MLNRVTLQGRLCRDVELRKLPSGKSVANVSVACDRDFSKDGGEKETDFIDLVAFGGTADHLAKWYTKGKMIIVSGRLQIRNYTDKEGNKRRSAEVVVDSCYFADSKKGADSGHDSSQNPYAETEAMLAKYMAQGANDSEFAMLEDDDPVLPF